MDPLIGTALDGRFEILERLGSGAKGVVYRATQLSIGRDVAVKVMSAIDDSLVKRFSHPNAVQIIELGKTPDGRVYLAMELVKGRTLREEMQEHKALASPRICHIGAQLCDALEAAHKLSIVHGDLKPENVMITLDDHVKILDFGIARVLDAAPAQDIHALGVMLGELAAGSSESLRPLIQRMCDPDPARRPSAAEARAQLRELDRVATDPAGIEPAPDLAALDNLQVVELADRTGAPPPPKQDKPPVVEPLGPDTINLSPSDDKIELEAGWRAEKAARQGAKPPLSPLAQRFVREEQRRRQGTRSYGLTVLLILVLAGATAYYFFVVRSTRHEREPVTAPDNRVPPKGVSIRIVGATGTPITVDGSPAGKTPIRLNKTTSKKAITVGANGKTWKVIPDRDQTIDITK